MDELEKVLTKMAESENVLTQPVNINLIEINPIKINLSGLWNYFILKESLRATVLLNTGFSSVLS